MMSLRRALLICTYVCTLFCMTQNSLQYTFINDPVKIGCYAATFGTMTYTVNDRHQHDPAVLIQAELQSSGSYRFVTFTAKEEHNNAVFKFIETVDGTSTTVCSFILLVEDPIEPSTNVFVERENNTHSKLQWTPPSGYSGVYEVEVYVIGTNRTETIRLESPGYAFLRYDFPVSFTISAVSMAGKGKPAFFNYPVPLWCHSAGANESVDVGLKNNSIYAVIRLYPINANSCFSEVSLQLQGYMNLSQTSLPTIRGDWAVIVLHDLPKHRNLDVSVFLNNLNFSIPISTHTVQDVNITVKEKTATVECVFLDGLSNATCYVVVTREGLPIYNKTISGLISLDFQGNYTVLIYCDAMETEPTFIRNVTRSTYDHKNKSTSLYALFVLLVLVLGVPVIAVVLYKKKCERTDHLSISPIAPQQPPSHSPQLSTAFKETSIHNAIKTEDLPVSQQETGTESQKIEPGRDSQNEYGLLRRNASAMSSVHRATDTDPAGMPSSHEDPKTKDQRDHIALEIGDVGVEVEPEFPEPVPVQKNV